MARAKSSTPRASSSHRNKCSLKKIKPKAKLSSAPRNIGIDVALDSGCTWHCTNRKADLINFRAECLNGISHSIRSNLTLSQIVQLYICAFQHPLW